ncbi:MAG TPA: hypothetical protein VE053_06625 [Allosphingosinicella sp.]|nr:hypothetical protein [Allosphingosinicella sp.]
MTAKVWLLWASQGDYSDRNEWPVHAYEDRESAEYAVVRLEALYRELKRRRDEWDENEPDDACQAEGYDWDWASKKAFRTKEGREFKALYGGTCDLNSYSELTLTCAEIEVWPPNLRGVIEKAVPA